MFDIIYNEGGLVKMSNIEEYNEKTFESIKHLDDLGNEYWEVQN